MLTYIDFDAITDTLIRHVVGEDGSESVILESVNAEEFRNTLIPDDVFTA